MTNDTADNKAATENETPEAEAPEAEATQPETTGEPTLEDALEAAQAEVADLKDKLLRAMAEAENLRRRGEREKEDTAKYAVTKFAQDLLPVADNLGRALDALPDDAKSDETFGSFVEGVELTGRELVSVFERHGIKEVHPQGEPFDHNLHQAMFEVEDADATPGTVTQVMQIGYTIGDRLLRAAMVGVAKAPAANKQESDGES